MAANTQRGMYKNSFIIDYFGSNEPLFQSASEGFRKIIVREVDTGHKLCMSMPCGEMLASPFCISAMWMMKGKFMVFQVNVAFVKQI